MVKKRPGASNLSGATKYMVGAGLYANHLSKQVKKAKATAEQSKNNAKDNIKQAEKEFNKQQEQLNQYIESLHPEIEVKEPICKWDYIYDCSIWLVDYYLSPQKTAVVRLVSNKDNSFSPLSEITVKEDNTFTFDGKAFLIPEIHVPRIYNPYKEATDRNLEAKKLVNKKSQSVSHNKPAQSSKNTFKNNSGTGILIFSGVFTIFLYAIVLSIFM